MKIAQEYLGKRNPNYGAMLLQYQAIGSPDSASHLQAT